ncbi:hypothetical protein AB0M02_42270 [Actinoplanes sp. NPDC051861]|uniref:hypothetical protein n=1 Tax=Actinoplanes sp. NPDC051861 TaxID=3155170 RepID=UPI003414FC78
MYERLVVGPRLLDHEWAEVWIDTGTGPGFVTRVPADRLKLAAIDDGNGDDAIYRLHLATEDVQPIQPGKRDHD